MIEGVVKKDNRFLNDSYTPAEDSQSSQETEEYQRLLKIWEYLKNEI
jgi:hypothetical protein